MICAVLKWTNTGQCRPRSPKSRILHKVETQAIIIDDPIDLTVGGHYFVRGAWDPDGEECSLHEETETQSNPEEETGSETP